MGSLVGVVYPQPFAGSSATENMASRTELSGPPSQTQPRVVLTGDYVALIADGLFMVN